MENKNIYPTWRDILLIVGVFFLSGIAISVVSHLLDIQAVGFNTFLFYTSQMVITIMFALILKKKRTGTYRDVMGFSIKGASPRIILYGVILVIAVSIVCEPLVEMFPHKYLEKLMDAVGTGGWAMLTTMMAAPILEETLFRGIIQEGLTRKYGNFAGIVIAALIFGAVHIIPQQVVMATFIGIVLGYIYYKTHSLLSVILIHGINNAFAQLTFIFTGDMSTTLRSMLNNDKIYFTVYGICIAVIVLSVGEITYTLRKMRTKTE